MNIKRKFALLASMLCVVIVFSSIYAGPLETQAASKTKVASGIKKSTYTFKVKSNNTAKYRVNAYYQDGTYYPQSEEDTTVERLMYLYEGIMCHFYVERYSGIDDSTESTDYTIEINDKPLQIDSVSVNKASKVSGPDYVDYTFANSPLLEEGQYYLVFMKDGTLTVEPPDFNNNSK